MDKDKSLPPMKDSRVDIDITGTQVTSLVRLGEEFIVILTGGTGKIYSPLADRMFDFPTITDMTLTFTVQENTETIEETLLRLQRESTLVSLLGRPSEPFLLVGQDGTEIDIPRRP